jgi:N-acetylglucosaminyldiphosphoundecaprenol N-acetyl-beta-D-mannosaminyltransferase
MSQTLEAIDEWVMQRQPHYVCVTNVHVVMECQYAETLRQTLNTADLVTPDGMPLVWVSRLRGFSQTERVAGPDLILEVCQRSVSKGYRHFLYGGPPGVPERLAKHLGQQIPGLQVCGTYSPPFRELTPQEDEQVIQLINGANPDIVWVGLGAPKQEYWMRRHVGLLTAPVMIGVGAAFDLHSGLKKRAPRWMQRWGLEWLFRLLSEPKRLWRRYLIFNPAFVVLALLQLLGLRHFE